jgi:hypothetical protein
MAAARTPLTPADLAGVVWRGTSLGMPAWFERATWTTFAKAFVLDERGLGRVRGWNLRVHQDGLGAPVRVRERGGAPWTFGHFVVRPTAIGVELDFGSGGERGPMATLRDELVALGPDLVLGRTDLALGPVRLPTPSYFVLERAGAVTQVAPAPGCCSARAPAARRPGPAPAG